MYPLPFSEKKAAWQFIFSLRLPSAIYSGLQELRHVFLAKVVAIARAY